MSTDNQLSDRMEFEHVVQVKADGTVVDRNDLHGPEMYEGEVGSSDWNLMTGYTGQYGYNGPSMHASEYIGGRMEADILANPGLYVALVDVPLDDSEPEGWGVAYIHDEGPYHCDGCGRVGTRDDGIAGDGDDCPDEDCDGTVHWKIEKGTS